MVGGNFNYNTRAEKSRTKYTNGASVSELRDLRFKIFFEEIQQIISAVIRRKNELKISN